MSTKRLFFIDAVRAFAILMMLQGHFIDALLEVRFRSNEYTAFTVWSYFRGITAPTFFTISGLIFTYLLIKAKQKGEEWFRIKKGLIRGIMLIGIGYLLRIPILMWFEGKFDTYWLVVDVLQCIGLSLIIIILLYLITFKKTLIFSVLLLVLGTVIFVTEPLYRNLDLSHLPIAIANYMSKANKSVFTILPWFGYMAYGGFISTLFYRYLERNVFKTSIIIGFITTGIILIKYSSLILYKLNLMTGIEVFKLSAGYNYLFTRLGDVLILFAVFYLLENVLKHFLILKIGQKTLSIYVIHFIIIYGSFTGLGLSQLIGKTLAPWEAVFGAFMFLILVCIIALNYVKTNEFIYSKILLLVNNIKRKFGFE
ncbi:DUF1624 domain-containing protein [Paucihalobacter ruber]|uniref:DUF1624 domain-containing protein n=1 Tax=Paucihalobacter ruber TaxID=2567861 RepID=A0A506PEJ6_9FLAO|nr:heparan-alpha-glucosaminide N-acetyltransferase domain-containing protein [Paucihalobacter ruber]TPV31462.1 DUF1624 domain-containing protein [Paucihalobacter ruber]